MLELQLWSGAQWWSMSSQGRQGIYIQIQLETINQCNADCCFCPFTKMTRPKGTMSLPLFRRIIDEVATIPAINHITLTGLGEPLLDRFLVERVRYIRSVVSPSVLVDLYTNGSFLRPQVSEALIDAGLSVLYVSLNAVSASKRLAIMKLADFDQVNVFIRHAIAYSELHENQTKVIVKAVVAKDLMEGDESSQFVDIWKGDYDKGGSAFRHLEGNWAGAMWPVRVPLQGACGRALEQIMVLWDGRVSLCCFDAHGKEILGDLNSQSIREVFSSPRATFIREAHFEGRRNEVELCAQCTGI